jgi:hypothetical protein
VYPEVRKVGNPWLTWYPSNNQADRTKENGINESLLRVCYSHMLCCCSVWVRTIVLYACRYFAARQCCSVWVRTIVLYACRYYAARQCSSVWVRILVLYACRYYAARQCCSVWVRIIFLYACRYYAARQCWASDPWPKTYRQTLSENVVLPGPHQFDPSRLHLPHFQPGKASWVSEGRQCNLHPKIFLYLSMKTLTSCTSTVHRMSRRCPQRSQKLSVSY